VEFAILGESLRWKKAGSSILPSPHLSKVVWVSVLILFERNCIKGTNSKWRPNGPYCYETQCWAGFVNMGVGKLFILIAFIGISINRLFLIRLLVSLGFISCATRAARKSIVPASFYTKFVFESRAWLR
jgi:hypothetical protein